MCVRVRVCMRERGTEKGTERGRGGERERERERFVCVIGPVTSADRSRCLA